MLDRESETALYAVAAELDTTIRAFDLMAPGAADDTEIILYFVANHLRPIHEKLMDEVGKLEKQRLHAV